MPRRILIVDDEHIKSSVMADELTDAGYEVQTAGDPLEAERILVDARFDVILSDLRMPGKDGISFLEDLRATRPHQQVMLMTAYGTVHTAVAAMKLGAFDYIQKPFSTEELLLKLERLHQFEALAQENTSLKKALAPQRRETVIIGDCACMREVKSRIHAVAKTDSDVLIHGESGTGKELVARAIHEASRRAQGPLEVLSCAAVPRELVEAEVFGHERGAFTGALKQRLGRFELANGGTLFLDDIDDVPLEAQVKLLRVLEERTFQRVGGEKPVRVNVRVIAATKTCLADLVRKDMFRSDLYYRLNVLPITIPPLRERLEDIPVLVEHFLTMSALRLDRANPAITQAAISRLKAFQWPGNVRQLKHMVDRILTFCAGDVIDACDIPDLEPHQMPGRPLYTLTLDGVQDLDLAEVMHVVEEDIIRWALGRCRNNLTQAAEMLHVPRTTLQYKITRMSAPHGAQEPAAP